MLVQSRKIGEEIVIGGNIRVVVVSVRGDRVRIGISAPKDVAVDREEVHEQRRQWHSEDAARLNCEAIS
jgi:carbon storage regulator